MERYQLNSPVYDWKCNCNSSFPESSKMDVLFLEVSLKWSVLATIHHIAADLTNEFLHVPKEGGVMEVTEITGKTGNKATLHI